MKTFDICPTSSNFIINPENTLLLLLNDRHFFLIYKNLIKQWQFDAINANLKR